MTKSILIGLNIIGILLLGFLEKSEVTVSQNLPDAIAPGEEVLVEVEIDKPDIMGFAKFQVSVEEGLTIEPVETAGASFTFSDNKAKFIWMALPSSKSFTMSYRIVADRTTTGSSRVSSRFSYIYESERKNYDLVSHEILLSGIGGEMASSEADALTARMTNEMATASISRKISPAGSNQWKVDLDISKSQLNGFAKIEETIPNGYTAIDLKSSNAVFSVENEIIKYIWYDIPQNDIVRVTYKLLPVVAADDNSPEIAGTFSFLVNDETLTIPIGMDIAPSNEAPLAQETPKDTTSALVADAGDTPMNQATEEVVKTQAPEVAIVPSVVTSASPSVAVTEEAPKIEKTEASETPVPAPKEVTKVVPPQNAVAAVQPSVASANPQSGIFYRVQIAAGKSNVRKGDFSKMYNFKEELVLENIEGWFKYTTGYHELYKEARDDRERIKSEYDKFNGPFVAAYNDGERISVQEALMISSQNWFQ